MSPEDIKQLIEGLPLKKRATTGEMLFLFLAIGFIFALGVWGALYTKSYFDRSHQSLLAAITKVDGDQSSKVDAVQKQVDGNSGSIAAIRRYYWSNDDMNRWAQALDHANRGPVPAFVVPEVPPPPQIPPH